jgi:hypothetical protein
VRSLHKKSFSNQSFRLYSQLEVELVLYKKIARRGQLLELKQKVLDYNGVIKFILGLNFFILRQSKNNKNQNWYKK